MISSKKFAVKESQSGRQCTGLLSQSLQGMNWEWRKIGSQLSEEMSGGQQFPVRYQSKWGIFTTQDRKNTACSLQGLEQFEEVPIAEGVTGAKLKQRASENYCALAPQKDTLKRKSNMIGDKNRVQQQRQKTPWERDILKRPHWIPDPERAAVLGNSSNCPKDIYWNPEARPTGFLSTIMSLERHKQVYSLLIRLQQQTKLQFCYSPTWGIGEFIGLTYRAWVKGHFKEHDSKTASPPESLTPAWKWYSYISPLVPIPFSQPFPSHMLQHLQRPKTMAIRV